MKVFKEMMKMQREVQLQRALDIVNGLLADWPLHTGKVRANFIRDESRSMYIGYYAGASPDSVLARDCTRFALNITGRDCYLMAIEILQTERGKGHGNQLYDILTQAAQELGCFRIIQTPSGWAVKDGVKGEARKDYLLRRGWSPWREDEVHKTLAGSLSRAALLDGMRTLPTVPTEAERRLGITP